MGHHSTGYRAGHSSRPSHTVGGHKAGGHKSSGGGGHASSPSHSSVGKPGESAPSHTSGGSHTSAAPIITPKKEPPKSKAPVPPARKTIEKALEKTFRGVPGTAVVQPSGRIVYGGGPGTARQVEAERERVAKEKGVLYKPLVSLAEKMEVETAKVTVPLMAASKKKEPTLVAKKEPIPKAKEATIQKLSKRISEYNVKAEQYKNVPWLSKDIKTETQLTTERAKLVALLEKQFPAADADDILSTGEKAGYYVGVAGETDERKIEEKIRGKIRGNC
jgi:hypothetical protein